MDANARPVADERDGLLTFLAQQRRVLKTAAYGLTPEQLRATPSASALSVGGLLKHVTFTERGWTDTIARKPRSVSVEDYGAEFRLTPEETLESLTAGYDEVAAYTDEVVAGIADLDEPVPVPDEPWFPKDITHWSVRWVLLHLIEEACRHAGHADIVRESIDGATAYELLAGAEGWEPTPWLRPWRPSASA
ncbi:MAG: DinB family protein [Actinophytocola sp.]|uniref:DinB family protein n=1 Tax=Actinophytocola sp. TaxID=1872138 RepID=UPI003D6A0370